jgi:hypothetical protein
MKTHLTGKAAAANDGSISTDLATARTSTAKAIDPALIDLLKDYKERHGLNNDQLGRRIGNNGTYVSRAFTGTFTGDVASFEEGAKLMLQTEVESRRNDIEAVEHGFLVEPMAEFLNTTKHSRSIGVAWCDPGKGKSKALEIYKKKDKLCVHVTLTMHMSGWRALRDAILEAIPNKKKMSHESWDQWLIRTFSGTGRLLILDNGHLATLGARHWLCYDWHDATRCPVALIGNERIVQLWKKDPQHESRVGVAYEVKPKQKPAETVQTMTQLYLPQAAQDEDLKGLAVQILKGKGACRAVEKHFLIAGDLLGRYPEKYTPRTALCAANKVLLTDVNLAA